MKTIDFILQSVLQLNKEDFEKYVYKAASEGDLAFVKKLFLMSSLNQKFKSIYNPQLLLLLGAIDGSKYDVFEYIMERQEKTGYELSLKKQEILFNNICWKGDVKLLEYIDNKLNISEYMISKANSTLSHKNNKNIYHIKLHGYECPINGYLVGCIKNNKEVIDYLLSKKNITKELIEEGFINACKNIKGIKMIESFIFSSNVFVSETICSSLKIKEYLIDEHTYLGHNINKKEIKNLIEKTELKNNLNNDLIEIKQTHKKLKV